MAGIIDATIPGEPKAAAALPDAHSCAAVGRQASRPRPGPTARAQAFAELKAEALGA